MTESPQLHSIKIQGSGMQLCALIQTELTDKRNSTATLIHSTACKLCCEVMTANRLIPLITWHQSTGHSFINVLKLKLIILLLGSKIGPLMHYNKKAEPNHYCCQLLLYAILFQRPYFHRTSQGELSQHQSRNSLSAFGSDLAGNLPPLVEGKLPIVAQLDAASRQNELLCNPAGSRDEEVENPTFIVVRVLEKGQTFVS